MITNTLTEEQEKINAISNLVALYPDLNNLAYWNRYEERPLVYAYVHRDPETLQRWGEILGHEEWTKKEDGENWNWEKTICGVVVRLVNCDSREPVALPVRSCDWPVLLADSNLSVV